MTSDTEIILFDYVLPVIIDLCFPVSGEYWIPGGLSTLLIDLEKDRGVHNEPHVWCEHRGAVKSL